MKKLTAIISLTVILLSYFLMAIPVFAITSYPINLEAVVAKGFNIRTGPGTNYTTVNSKGTTIGQNVSINAYAFTDDGSDGCETGVWYYVTTYAGWVCTNGIALNRDLATNVSPRDMEKMTDAEFEQYLVAQGFPTSYWAGLKTIHAKYPNWVFKGVNTYRVWENTIRDEAEPGMSTYMVNAAREAAGHEAYLNTDAKYDWAINMFYAYDGSGFLANKATIAHFMDPRNFLNETNVFMFQDHYYKESDKDAAMVKSILGTDEYTNAILAAGRETNISPIALATRIKQEGTIGRNPTKGISTECNTTLDTYVAGGVYKAGPLYNFYNIGAHAGGTSAQMNGLCFASQQDEKSGRPWNTVEKAIKGGALDIGNRYTFVGQYTTYFMKYNVASSNTKALGHQYMTNIEDPKDTSSILYTQYKNNNALNSDFVFYIPYYFNMPAETAKLPTLGNPNNLLTSLKVNGSSISAFDIWQTEYTLAIDPNATSVTIDATTVAKTSNVSINGEANTLKTGSRTVNLSGDTTAINVIVTAANGWQKTYKVNITKNGNGDSGITPIDPTPPSPTKMSVDAILLQAKLNKQNNYVSGVSVNADVTAFKTSLLNIEPTASISIKSSNGSDKSSGKLVTGDIVTITSNNETKAIEIIIYGDINGDGIISIKDLLSLQKHLLSDAPLTNAYLKASDVNKDGFTNIKDLLQVQKTLLGDANIYQS